MVRQEKNKDPKGRTPHGENETRKTRLVDENKMKLSNSERIDVERSEKSVRER